MTTIFLDIISLITVISAVFVITARNPVVSVVFLITTFISAACYLLIIGVNFIGLSYLVVYVGAVAVLFLFVIIILNVRISEIVSVGREWSKNLPLAIIVTIVFFFEIVSIIPSIYSEQKITRIFSFIESFILNLNSQNLFTNHFAIWNITTPDQIIYHINQVQVLGESIYFHNPIWLLISSIILLVAIIGPICLCVSPRTSR